MAAEKHGIDYQTAWVRNNSGWPIKAVLGLAPPPNEKQMIQPVVVGDHKFSSQAEFARFLGISPALVTQQKNKLSHEEIYKKYINK